MKYDWRNAGEEWSAPWGSSSAQWFGAILPRISDYLPSGTILEIAPGFGRWTHYLKDYCQQLWIVDRSAECIEACRKRFAAEPHVRCYLNDGRSLSMIPDDSVDFVFSFDSFVHPNRELIEAYLRAAAAIRCACTSGVASRAEPLGNHSKFQFVMRTFAGD